MKFLDYLKALLQYKHQLVSCLREKVDMVVEDLIHLIHHHTHPRQVDNLEEVQDIPLVEVEHL